MSDPKLPEVESGTEVFSVDPLIVKWHYEIDYVHSYAQDSEWFRALAKRKLLGSRCDGCNYVYATPRGHCMYCGRETEWFELPQEGRIHAWTTCYFGGEAFLKETPFHLALIEFDGVDTLFLTRIVGAERDSLSVGLKVRARFRRKCTWSPSDVYFVKAE